MNKVFKISRLLIRQSIANEAVISPDGYIWIDSIDCLLPFRCDPEFLPYDNIYFIPAYLNSRGLELGCIVMLIKYLILKEEKVEIIQAMNA